MSRVLHRMISVSVADGTRMDVYEAYPENSTEKQLPGVMLFQEAFGVNDHIRDVARRIAAEGYVVMAPELYHRTGPGFVCSYTDFSAAREHIQALTLEGLEADIRATAAALSAHPACKPDQLASIGFCLGAGYPSSQHLCFLCVLQPAFTEEELLNNCSAELHRCRHRC